MDKAKFLRWVAEDACWLWPGKIGVVGYGVVVLDGKETGAHRAAWEIEHGSIPDGMQVCHKCDEPRCVRPSHLFLGTFTDNMADKVRKDRHAKGERAKSKLKETDVHAIRRQAAAGVPLSKLAYQYSVDPSTVSQIVSRKRWAWLISTSID